MITKIGENFAFRNSILAAEQPAVTPILSWLTRFIWFGIGEDVLSFNSPLATKKNAF